MPARLVPTLAALAALALPLLSSGAAAQQPRPGAARPQAQPAQPPAPPPGFFPCRTAEEVCFIGVASGNSEVSVLFTNAPNAEGIETKPLPATSTEGAPLDLAGSFGRVVLLTGSYDKTKGLTGATLVETASPLTSFLIKSTLAGDEPAPAAPPPKRR
jgi:hypothetical protein